MREIKNIRNALWVGRFTKGERELFDECRMQIEKSSSNYKELMLFCMDCALEDIESGDHKMAAREIGVIHELPVDDEDFEEWDEAWFYKNQLSEYFDKNKNIDRVKRFIDILAKSQLQES